MSDLNLDEVPTAGKITNPDYDVKENYCRNCGGEVHTSCPKCGYTVRSERHPKKYRGTEFIPDFCSACGEPFPWIDTVEAEKQREGDFIEIDDADIDGHFYPGLVYEINLCYKVQADQAVLVLNRKLIENLIADSLRAAFGMDEMELFYNEEEGQIHSLSILIENMEDRKAELQRYVPLEEPFFKAVKDMKYHGDASAHSIEENPAQHWCSVKPESVRSAEYRL